MRALPIALVACAVLAGAARPADANLIVNGDFEQVAPSAGSVQVNWNGYTLPGWTVGTGASDDGFTFVFQPGTLDTTGATGMYGSLKMWGSNDGGLNVLTGSPTGGNILASDGAFRVAAVKQTVTGLVVGASYALSFDWAGAQQLTYNGATTDKWQVTFGTQTQSTAVVNDASHGFTGWMHETMVFTATSTSQVLQFLAAGTPSGLPPFSLLDGVKMEQVVPEPTTLSLLAGLTGVAVLGAWRRRR